MEEYRVVTRHITVYWRQNEWKFARRVNDGSECHPRTTSESAAKQSKWNIPGNEFISYSTSKYNFILGAGYVQQLWIRCYAERCSRHNQTLQWSNFGSMNFSLFIDERHFSIKFAFILESASINARLQYNVDWRFATGWYDTFDEHKIGRPVSSVLHQVKFLL